MRLLLDTDSLPRLLCLIERKAMMVGCKPRMRQISAAALACCAMAYCLLSEVGSASELPRYKFKVGQELVYEVTGDERFHNKIDNDQASETPIGRQMKWWVWVTRQNDGGGWRLLIRKRVKLLKISPDEEPWVRFENDFLAYCDLAPNGSFTLNSSLGSIPFFDVNPEDLFVRLPSDHSAVDRGWKYTSRVDGADYRFAVVKSDADKLSIAGTVERGYHASYEMHHSRQVDFDARRGIVTQVVDEAKGEWQRNPEHWRMTVELISVNHRDPAWIAQLDAESEHYLAASRAWGKLFLKSVYERTKAGCRDVLDEARGLFVNSRKQVALDELQELIDARLTLHDRDIEANLDAAAKREELYAKPALDWETTDFDGQPQRLVDYRGKVVVLDFWYRGCGHCILALPTVKQFASHYEDADVVVLGVNNDSQEADARHVIDAYELHYPNLRAGDIPEQYGVNAWPTFIVLDQTGRIAAYVEGNAQDLFEHVTSVVDDLLANPPSTE